MRSEQPLFPYEKDKSRFSDGFTLSEGSEIKLQSANFDPLVNYVCVPQTPKKSFFSSLLSRRRSPENREVIYEVYTSKEFFSKFKASRDWRGRWKVSDKKNDNVFENVFIAPMSAFKKPPSLEEKIQNRKIKEDFKFEAGNIKRCSNL